MNNAAQLGGWSLCGSQCCQSLCFHFCLQLWSVPSTRHTYKTGNRGRENQKDGRRAPLLTARKHVGVLGLFFWCKSKPHLHILVKEDSVVKGKNSWKAVRQNSAEATAGVVVASRWPMQRCISHRETDTHQHAQRWVASMCRKATAEKKDSGTSAASSHTSGYQHTLSVWCLQRGKKWDKTTELNKYYTNILFSPTRDA